MSDVSPLWSPSKNRIETSEIRAFLSFLSERRGIVFQDYDDLHDWSVKDAPAFWDTLWDFCDVVGDKGERLIENPDQMPGAKFFPDAQLCYAENALKTTGTDDAIVFWGEDKVKRRLSWDELAEMVSKIQQGLRDLGVGEGDRVAGMLPNVPETVAVFLAVNALGAIWSSCSPDFGERGVLDRFGQIEPKVFFACDGYWYNGKQIEVVSKLEPIVQQMPSVEAVVIVPYLNNADAVAAKTPRAITLTAFTNPYVGRGVSYLRRNFNAPLYILFSSGTTGVPKCIVHGAGGSLLQHLKEHRLQSNLKPGDRTFYFTTCGWMMWNWLITGLANGETLLLYDGSPFAPSGNILFDYADEEQMTLFGTSAKFIDAVRNGGLSPKSTHSLASVQGMASTGSPLAPENFAFVYEHIKEDLHLASISGGTDIVSCFVIGIPTKPVYIGEIQGPGLGMAVDVWSDDGQSTVQEKGELVCTRPFPSMPVMFWNDPDGAKYKSAYFERFDGVWCHGDFAEITENGGLIIHGRSDATLNPGGVRIGTAEIYNVVEQMPEIQEALAIGQDWDGDVRVVLFVRLNEGVELTEQLQKAIKSNVRTGCSPRHVPARIVAVSDIPRTKSGKIVELAVREVVHNRPVKNKEALANPEALALYADVPELQS